LSIRFQADNDLKRIIVDATLRREPRIDFQTAQAARLDDLDDEAVLRLAGSQSRILGVLLVIPQSAPIREVVEALILIWADERAEDWRNLIAKIPL
jgi:hypothetical protein